MGQPGSETGIAMIKHSSLLLHNKILGIDQIAVMTRAEMEVGAGYTAWVSGVDSAWACTNSANRSGFSRCTLCPAPGIMLVIP